MTWKIQLIAALLLPAILLFVGAVTSPLLAHDHNRPELNEWFHSLHSKGRAPCCDGSDATSLDDPDWGVVEYAGEKPKYRVRIDGNWTDVPDEAVVDAPNRDGRAMVWPYLVNGEMRGIRCFMPGSMS